MDNLETAKLCITVCKLRTEMHVLPFRTIHVQSPLDTVGYDGQGLMISAAGLGRDRDIRLLLCRKKGDFYSWRELIKSAEAYTCISGSNFFFVCNEQRKQEKNPCNRYCAKNLSIFSGRNKKVVLEGVKKLKADL